LDRYVAFIQLEPEMPTTEIVASVTVLIVNPLAAGHTPRKAPVVAPLQANEFL